MRHCLWQLKSLALDGGVKADDLHYALNKLDVIKLMVEEQKRVDADTADNNSEKENKDHSISHGAVQEIKEPLIGHADNVDDISEIKNPGVKSPARSPNSSAPSSPGRNGISLLVHSHTQPLL